MKQYSDTELDAKIQAFMSRKAEQYPEVLRPRTRTWHAIFTKLAAPQSATLRTLKTHTQS